MGQLRLSQFAPSPKLQSLSGCGLVSRLTVTSGRKVDQTVAGLTIYDTVFCLLAPGMKGNVHANWPLRFRGSASGNTGFITPLSCGRITGRSTYQGIFL